MKTLTKSVILLAVLILCSSAHAEILIYSKTVKGFAAEGEGVFDLYDRSKMNWRWGTGELVDKGFLVLDVDIDPNTQIVEINDAMQIEYWKDGKIKHYEQISYNFEIDRIEVDKRTYWILRDIYAPENDQVLTFMAKGKVRMNNIGLGSRENRREIPLKLEGLALTFLQDSDDDGQSIYEEIFDVSLRLHQRWTRMANQYWLTYDPYLDDYSPFEWAVGGVDRDSQAYGIVGEWLIHRGYTEGDRDNVIIDDSSQGEGDQDDSGGGPPPGVFLF
jgi:hypothetical protein